VLAGGSGMVVAIMRIAGKAAEAVSLAMPVVMIVVVIVIMVMMIMVVIVVMMAMIVRLTGIGAAYRLERLADIRHRRAEPFKHILDHVVAQDEDALLLDLRGEMAVADVPAEFGKVHGIDRADLVEFLCAGDDLHLAAVVQYEAVAGLQHHRLDKVDQHAIALLEFEDTAAQMPLVVLQHQHVERFRLAASLAGRQHAAGARQLGEIGVYRKFQNEPPLAWLRARAGRASSRSK